MFTEQQLAAFTNPASDSEEAQCERATRMIREAVQEHAELRGRSFEIIAQGSFPNNTNARTNSDVDVCVVFDDVFQPDYTYMPGESLQSLGYTPSDKVYTEDRAAVLRALTAKFGKSAITEGNKAYDVHSVQGSRVDADVVPAWRFKGFKGRDAYGQVKYADGIVFWGQDGTRVVNFPEQHQANGKVKNTATTGFYKKAVRILKHVRYQMLMEEAPSADGVSSFLIECMLYNVPDSVFFSTNDWRGTMQGLLHHMHEALGNGISNGTSEDWTEVSGEKWLFDHSYGIPANWTRAQAKTFVYDAYQRIGY